MRTRRHEIVAIIHPGSLCAQRRHAAAHAGCAGTDLTHDALLAL
jgi:hypothetical protein